MPAHKNLIGANIELVEAERREYRLRDALSILRERFQFIVLDCPPALDLLTLNALVAADAVLIPMQAEYFALEGISELMDTVERIRGSFNPDLTIEGVVLTMLDERTNLAQQVMAELKRFFGEKLCATTHSAEHSAGGGAQPRTSGAAVRSAIEGSGELYPAGQGDHCAPPAGGRAGAGGGDGQDGIDRLMTSMLLTLMIIYIHCAAGRARNIAELCSAGQPRAAVPT